MKSFYQLIILSNIFFQFILAQFVTFNKQTFEIVNNCLLFKNASHPSILGQKDNPSSNIITNQCIQCQNGYYLDQGNCVLIPNCSNPIVNQVNDIISCEEGIYLGYYAQSFFQCPNNCISCSKQESEIICKNCKNGYARKKDGSCYPPPSYCIQASVILVKLSKNDSKDDQVSSNEEEGYQQQQQSLQMTELIQCDLCETGFITYDSDYSSPSDYYNQCIKCSEIIDNCQNCSLVLDQKYICSSCDEGYYLTQDKNQSSVCQKCSNNCQFCIFGQVQYNAPFALSSSQAGVEEREICLKCPKGYGFHYDGKTCVQCNQCDQCYYLVNKQYVYTLGTNFKAITDDDIAQLKLQIELACSYQTCSEGCIDQFNICQTKYKISGCSLCATQKISSDLSKNALTCKQCFSDKQMKVQIQSTMQNQYCLDKCSNDCQQCDYDGYLQIQTCSQCKKLGNYQLEYQQAIDELNNLLGNEDMIKYNSQHYLFLLQNPKSKKCLNCMFGCYECQSASIYKSENETDNYTIAIDQMNLIQQVQLLSQYYPQYFKSNDFAFPSQDSVDIVNSNCIKCQDGYQLIVPQMKCIKCSENKFCKFKIQNIQYDLAKPDYDQLSFDEMLRNIFDLDWLNINHFYQMNQLNIQDIQVILNLGKRTYSFKDSYSLNLSYMKSGKIFTNSKLKLVGGGPETVLQISQNFSILFFTQIEIQDMKISIDNQKSWIMGAFEDNNSIVFSGVIFQAQHQMGSIVLFNNYAKLEISKCVFDGNFASNSDFIQLIDPTPYNDTDYAKFEDLNITIFGNYFTPNFTSAQHFLQTQFFTHVNINLEMKQNTFMKCTLGSFLSVSAFIDMNFLSYKNRFISIVNNTFDMHILSGQSFFQDSTLDYVYLDNNIIYNIYVEKTNDLATTLFSFFQGKVLNTVIASIHVPQAKFYLFDFTGTKDYTDMYLCIDPTVKLINFTTIDPYELTAQIPSFNLLNYGLQGERSTQNQNNSNFRHLEQDQFGNHKYANQEIHQRILESEQNIISQQPLIILSNKYQILVNFQIFFYQLENSQNNFRKSLQISNFYMSSVYIYTDGSPLIEIEASLITIVQNFTLYDSLIYGDVFRAQSYNFTANNIKIKNVLNDPYFFIRISSLNFFVSDIEFLNPQDQYNLANKLVNYQDSTQVNADYIDDYKYCDFDSCVNYDGCIIQTELCTQGMPIKKCDSLGQTIKDFCQQEEYDENQNTDEDQNGSKLDQKDENDIQDQLNNQKSLQQSKNQIQNQNGIDYSICDILKFKQIPIIIEELTFNTNGELINEITIQNITVQDRLISNSLITIKNNQNYIQKIEVKNIILNNIIQTNSNISNQNELPLFMNVNSARSVLIMNNITAQGIYALNNSIDTKNTNNKVLITCFLQIQVQRFLVKHLYYANLQNSRFEILQQQYKILEYAPRFVDFVGQTLSFNHTKFVNINALSGGVVRASSNQNSDFFFYNMTVINVFVNKSGGLFYFYSSIGTSVTIHIQNAILKNIYSEMSNGLIDINNLQNPTNIYIINCGLINIHATLNSFFHVSNMNSFILLQDIEIFEEPQQYTFSQQYMISLKNTEIRLINIKIYSLYKYSTLFNFDQSVILFHNVTIQDIEVLLGVFLFQRSQVSSNVRNISLIYNTFDNRVLLSHVSLIYYNQIFVQGKVLQYHVLMDAIVSNNSLPEASKGSIKAFNTQIIIRNSTFQYNIVNYGGGLFIQTSNNDAQSVSEKTLPNDRFLKQIATEIQKYVIPQQKKQKFRNLEDKSEVYYTQNSKLLPTNNSQAYYKNFEQDKLWVLSENQPDFKEKYENIFLYTFQYIFIIDECKFLHNYAFAQGGAIYVDINDDSRDLLVNQVAILNSDISHNTAEINSPGIGSLTFIPYLHNNTSSNNAIKYKVITAFNIAPSNLNIYYQNGTAVLNLKNISSGQLFDQGDLIVEFSNINGEKVYLNDPSLVLTAKKPQVFLAYDQIKIAIDTFSFENGTITIQPQQYIYTPGSVVDFIFSSPNILTPVRFDGEIIFEIQSNKYEKIIKAHFRSCQVGEIYFKDKKICSTCSFGTYSLEDPQSARCKNCPQGGYCLGGNQISLLEGYWSDITIKQDEIIFCSRNPSNCIGQVSQETINNREFKPQRSLYNEEQNQFFPCLEGHIGALCEVCDLTGIKNGVRYYQTEGYQCEKCSDLVSIYVKFGFYILISVAIALITVYTLVSEIQNKIIKNTLKIIGILMVGINSQYYQIASSLFKIIINYAQINLIIYTLDLQIPNELSNIFLSIISPFKFLQTGFDCLLSNIFSVQVVFIKSIGFCLLPILYYVILLFILTIVETLKRKFIKSYYFYTACFFITLFSIPNVIQYLALVLSCRQVGSQKYIAADMSQICYSSQHFKYIKSVIIPGIVVYGLLIPLLFVCILHFNRDKFEQNMFEMKYGFLYREYKTKVFYWEIVRLGCKEIIFISVSIWDEQQELKAMIVCLLLIFYYGLLQRVQPFKNQLLNKYEQISTTLNIISIILALIVKQISNHTINILLYVFIIGQNTLFISFIVYKVISIYRANIVNCLNLIKIKALVCLKFSDKEQIQEMQDKQANDKLIKSKKISKNWQILRIYIFVLQFYKKLNKSFGMYSSQVIFSFMQAKQNIEILNNEISMIQQKINLQKFLLRTVDKLKSDQSESFIVEGKVVTPLLQASQDDDNKNINKLQLDFQQNMMNFNQVFKNPNSNKDDYYKNDGIYVEDYQPKNEHSPTFFSQNQTGLLNSSETPFKKNKNHKIDNLQYFQNKNNLLNSNFDWSKRNKEFIQQENKVITQILPISNQVNEIELQNFDQEINNQFKPKHFCANDSQKIQFNNFQDSVQFSQQYQDFEQNDVNRLIDQQKLNKINCFSPQSIVKLSNFSSQNEKGKDMINDINKINEKDKQFFENEANTHFNQSEKLIQFKDQNNFSFDKKIIAEDQQEIVKNLNVQQNNILLQHPNMQQNLDNDDEVIKFDSDDSDYDFTNDAYYNKQMTISKQLEAIGKLSKNKQNNHSDEEQGKKQNLNQDEGNSGDAFIS
ncbi:hypothetical protein ABPG74_016030 [Tetrahymena malaccensis]